MTKMLPKNEATLRAVMKIGNASLHDVENIVGDVAKNAINSLYRCDFLQIVGARSQRTKQGCMKEMHVYAITDKGRQILQDIDYPTYMEVRSIKACKLDEKLHQMQNIIIPISAPSVKEMIAEIAGRKVKITYGVHIPYEVYRPAPDNSRNYTPRPLRSILAM